MSEAAIQKRVMIEATRLGLRVFRNNVGVLKDRRGIPVTYGLCVGSTDLIGWTPKGQFVAIECKTEIGIVSPEQKNFLQQVSKAGGFACICRNEKNLKLALDAYYMRVY